MSIFPKIQHINDVLPHIQGFDEIMVMQKDGCTVIDYTHMDSKTFTGDPKTELSCQMRRECRGLIFDEDGKLISRAFHKFFNVGEREETLVENIDWTRGHTVMQKLDGSMIRPVVIDGCFRLGTRKGITNVSNMAENYVVTVPEIPYKDFCMSLTEADLTPIFEFHSLENIVVLDYEGTFMKLLAIRDNLTGDYHDAVEMNDIAESWGIPYVELIGVDLTKPDEFLTKTAGEVDSEGYVIRFHDDGQTLKVKNDWYFAIHHVISGLNSEKNIVRLLIDNEMDDILPKIPDNRRLAIEEFAKEFWDNYSNFFTRCNGIWESIHLDLPEDYTRKEIALRILQEDKAIQTIMFKFIDLSFEERHAFIKDFIKGRTNKDVVFEEFMAWFKEF